MSSERQEELRSMRETERALSTEGTGGPVVPIQRGRQKGAAASSKRQKGQQEQKEVAKRG